ncbi:HPP family protein [Streptomyces sp. NBC_00094]|uniref:CBS domain-containing protein n=1 Tax=Streptomyces sp. NBC_00094 TaxID=2903620 RepID=UPI002250D0C9|nr:CBS domain-containing protein [Streptomyces sp. NBC_00094]MCX5393180.1 CBS domain-containing protein [Streptomyces sp. NBC_00094]
MAQNPSEEELLALKGRQIPVQDLLSLFGTRLRNGLTVPRIEQALKDVGLTTLPYFGTCNHGADVHVVTWQPQPQAAPEETGGEGEDDGEGDQEEPGAGGLPARPLRIGDIPSATGGLFSVEPDTPLTQVTWLMRTKGYSQIPVIERGATLCGVVTWSSVAKVYETTASAVLAEAMVEDPPVVEAHHDFFQLLPRVSDDGYLLVRASDGSFCGIVTTADITQRFDATAWPFFVVGEIESRLRKCLGARIGEDAIRAVQLSNKRTGLITDLMFGGYVKLLDGDQQNPALRTRSDENWQALGWPGVDRVQFVRQLDRVRVIRNGIAHFDAEPLSPRSAKELREFVGLLRQLT